MAFCQSLQGCKYRWHPEVVGIGGGIVGHLLHDERAHAATVEVGNVSVTIALAGVQGEEQRLFGETE